MVLVLFLYHCFVYTVCGSIIQIQFTSLKSFDNHITSAASVSFIGNSLLWCANKCAQRTDCRSFHYDGLNKRCDVINYYVTVVDIWQYQIGVKTFWRPSDGCPTTSGYSHLTDSNTCVHVADSAWKNWDDAQDICRDDGGFLMIMDTLLKYNSIVYHFIAEGYPTDTDYSIGARNQTFFSTTEFVWMNGEKMDFQSWFPGMPEDTTGGNERCVEFVPHWYHWSMADDTWHWNDITCDWIIRYICEIPMA